MTTSGSVWIWVSGGGRNGDWLDVSFEDSGGAGMARDPKGLESSRIRMERGLTLRWARMEWMRANGSLEANSCLGIHGWLVKKNERDERESLKERRGYTYGRGKSFAVWKSWSSLAVVVVVVGRWSGANKGKGSANDRFLFFQFPVTHSHRNLEFRASAKNVLASGRVYCTDKTKR